MTNKIGWVDAPIEVVEAFNAGIGFGRMVESRRPRRDPQYSEDEWREALAEAVSAGCVLSEKASTERKPWHEHDYENDRYSTGARW